MDKEQQIRKVELAIANAITAGKASGRTSANVLDMATIYGAVPGFDFDLVALSFPKFQDGGPYLYCIMASSIEGNSDTGLAELILEDLDEAIDDGDLPADPSEFEISE